MAQVINDVVVDTGGEKWMTMLFCAIELKTGQLKFASAGHNPPLLRKATNEILTLYNSGNPIGSGINLDLRIESRILDPGDTIFIYTDGLIENSVLAVGRKNTSEIRTLFAHGETGLDGADFIAQTYDKLSVGKEAADDVSFMAIQWNG